MPMCMPHDVMMTRRDMFDIVFEGWSRLWAAYDYTGVNDGNSTRNVMTHLDPDSSDIWGREIAGKSQVALEYLLS